MIIIEDIFYKKKRTLFVIQQTVEIYCFSLEREREVERALSGTIDPLIGMATGFVKREMENEFASRS